MGDNPFFYLDEKDEIKRKALMVDSYSQLVKPVKVKQGWIKDVYKKGIAFAVIGAAVKGIGR